MDDIAQAEQIEKKANAKVIEAMFLLNQASMLRANPEAKELARWVQELSEEG